MCLCEVGSSFLLNIMSTNKVAMEKNDNDDKFIDDTNGDNNDDNDNYIKQCGSLCIKSPAFQIR